MHPSAVSASTRGLFLEIASAHPRQFLGHQCHRQVEEIEQHVKRRQQRMDDLGKIWSDRDCLNRGLLSYRILSSGVSFEEHPPAVHAGQ